MESELNSLTQLKNIIEEFKSKLPAPITDANNRVNALVLDPDKASRKELKPLLEKLGFMVFGVSTIAEAGNIVESIKDLSLVISVPRMDNSGTTDGIDFLSQLKSKYPDVIPILSVSFAESEDAVGALRKNIVGFFIKPYDENEVTSNLIELLYLYNKYDFVVNLIQQFLSNYNEWDQNN